uniref:Uncharacterized protein n=1 Tax=Anguilla anguilla TaxID=7936 RepID=A0A0E9UAH6_ANGAN
MKPALLLYPSSPETTVLSSETLYIMDGSRDTFSMNIGEVVMFWIWASRRPHLSVG